MKKPLIMGILNVTPDSFSDGGLFDASDRAYDHAQRLVAEGADILDIGAESTRPGHAPISAEEECARLTPVLDALHGIVSVPLSIDTYKAETAAHALKKGVSIVNDVWGLQRDDAMADVVADHDVPVIIMHNRFDGADPAINILDDMDRWFETSLNRARIAGVKEDKIVLDPGIGFGKDYHQNLTVLANLNRIKRWGYPLLMGLSRKRFLGTILDAEVDDRLFGTITANMWSLMEGCAYIRVHDVKPHSDMIKTLLAIDAARL